MSRSAPAHIEQAGTEMYLGEIPSTSYAVNHENFGLKNIYLSGNEIIPAPFSNNRIGKNE